MNDRAIPSGHELEHRIQRLRDAEANYWAAMDDPQTAEAARISAAEMLEEAETRVRELTTAPVAAETATGTQVVQTEQGLEAEF